MTTRAEGWYWVKETDNWPWTPVRWDGLSWFSSDGYEVFCDIIGPRIPTPDEPWQCVPVEATADMLDVLTLGHLVTAPRRWREALAAAPKPGGAQ